MLHILTIFGLSYCNFGPLHLECDEYNDGVTVSSAHRRFRRDGDDDGVTHLEDAVVRLQREVERLSAMIDNHR